jgi:hypothetical protein
MARVGISMDHAYSAGKLNIRADASGKVRYLDTPSTFWKALRAATANPQEPIREPIRNGSIG